MTEQNGLPEKFGVEELDSLFPEHRIIDTAQLSNVAKESAADYLYSGFVLFERLDDSPRVASTCAVISAFSCELYLKSIIYKTGKSRIIGHDLEELFNELPADARAEILSEIEKKDPQNYFMTGLRENRNVFMTARYLFERTRTNFNPSFLLSFAQILSDYIALKS